MERTGRAVSTFRAPAKAREHAAAYEQLGVPLWQTVRHGQLFQGEELARLQNEIFVPPEQPSPEDVHEACKVTLATQDFPFLYEKLLEHFEIHFGEPLLAGGVQRMDMFSLRWSPALMLPNAPIGFPHEDGDDLELCVESDLPTDLAAPESTGWRWDSHGTVVALLIGLRVPDAHSGRGHSFVFSDDVARGDVCRQEWPQQQELTTLESVGEGEFVTFNPYRFHSQYVPSSEDFSTSEFPQVMRQHIIGFGARQVPISVGSRCCSGRWVLLRMCKGVSDPDITAPVRVEGYERKKSRIPASSL